MFRKMKSNTYLPAFYSQIEACTKDVYFVTNEGNRINLKSMMSQIFFLTTFAHTKSHGEEASSIEIKANSIFEPFDAIALARKANDSSNHSFWYDTKNFVIND